jgi:DNA recombination protein RmuC
VLVSARKFPGIDATKLDAVSEPAPIEKAPRRLTAPEMLDRTLEEPERDQPSRDHALGEAMPTTIAELGDVRARIGDPNG